MSIDEMWGLALMAAIVVVTTRLSWRTLRRQGIGGVPFVLFVGLVLMYFVQPWLNDAYQQAGTAGRVALVFFAGMLAVLALLPKTVRDVVLGNLVYDLLKGLFTFLGQSVRGIWSSWTGRWP